MTVARFKVKQTKARIRQRSHARNADSSLIPKDVAQVDLDPVEGTPFERVCETAKLVHQALDSLKIPNFAKTTGSRGIHVYVPIVRGPLQKDVWMFARELARVLQDAHPKLIT